MGKSINWKQVMALALLLAIWEGIYRVQFWPSFLLPSPYQVFTSLCEGFGDFSLVIAVLASIKRLLIGYIIAICLGSIIGAVLAKFKWVQETFSFLILGFQTIPSIVWLPLSLLWFGLNDKAIIFVVVIGALWTMVISVETAIRGVQPLLIKAGRTLGYQGIKLFIKVIFPASLPEYIAGLRLAWAFAWRSLMAGELLGGETGLGQVLMTGRNLGDMTMVISIMIIIGIIGSLIDLVVFKKIENRVFQKWGYL